MYVFSGWNMCARAPALCITFTGCLFKNAKGFRFFFSSFLAFPKGKLNIEHAAFFSAITLRASEATFSAQMALCVSVFPHIDSISKGNTNNVPLVKS